MNAAYFESDRLLAEEHLKTGMGLSLSKTTIAEDCPLHWHDFFEIELILAGKGIQRLNGVCYEIQKGSIYFLTPADFHEIHVQEKLILINIMFRESIIPSELLHPLMQNARNNIFPLTENRFTYLQMLMETLHREFSGTQDYKTNYIQGLLTCIFIEIARSQTLDPTMLFQNANDSVEKVILFLHSHFRENPSLKLASEIAGLRPNYFCEIFHRAIGKRYSQYLNELKLNFAKNLIMTSDLPITDIGYASGFSTLSHFLREFKARYSKRPSDFRKRKQQDPAISDNTGAG